MSNIILPYVDFSKVECKNKNKLLDDEMEELNINEIRNSQIRSMESENSDDEEKNLIEEHVNIADIKPPVFDGTEPHHMFMRRWNNYMILMEDQRRYKCMLDLMNKLMNTEYKYFNEFDEIEINSLPDVNFILEECMMDAEFKKCFKIQKKDFESSLVLIQYLLGKIEKKLVVNKKKMKKKRSNIFYRII